MAAPWKYSEELRDRAVRLAFESGPPIAHVVAQGLGMHKEALRTRRVLGGCRGVRNKGVPRTGTEAWHGSCLSHERRLAWT